jgi:hypothetical protein
MFSTHIKRMFSAVIAVALISLWSSPSWARGPEPVCPTCSIKPAEFTIPWGLTGSELVRVCLMGVVTRPRSAAITWHIRFFGPDGVTLLTKHAQVPEHGFRCLDTSSDELRLAGLATDPNNRLQFGLRMTPHQPVPSFLDGRPVEIPVDGTVWHSVETVDLLTLGVTNSHRSTSKGFGFVTFSRGESAQR